MIQIIVANVLSFFASLAYIVGLRKKETKDMILFFNINTLLHIISNFVLQAYTGAIVGITNIIRNELAEKKKLNISLVLLLLIFNFLLSYKAIKDVIDLFPLVGSTINVFGFLYLSEGKSSEDQKEINFKLAKSVASVFWVIYYAKVLNISATVFEAAFILIGLYVVMKRSKKSATE